eukprot:3021441-Alexandrium_andersonii.AAC.1
MMRADAPRMWFSRRLFPCVAAATARRQATCSASQFQRQALFWCVIAITQLVVTFRCAHEDYC